MAQLHCSNYGLEPMRAQDLIHASSSVEHERFVGLLFDMPYVLSFIYTVHKTVHTETKTRRDNGNRILTRIIDVNKTLKIVMYSTVYRDSHTYRIY